MKQFKTYLFLIFITAVLSGQILWNEPPDTIWYSNHSRWVEVILPTPQNLIGCTFNNNQIKLTWDEYWTQSLLVAYKAKFGQEAIPNRFSLYRQNITNGDMQLQAIPGTDWHKTEYIDADVELGKEYLYKIMAQDKNYLTYGGLQRWSPRSEPAIVTVGASSLSCPSNFYGCYIPNSAVIKLTWDSVPNVTSYTIFKSYINPDTNSWKYLVLPIGNVYEYNDVKLLKNLTYFYQIISINASSKSNRSSTIMVTSGTLGIEDGEYLEDVEEYEKDRKIGWFGCSTK